MTNLPVTVAEKMRAAVWVVLCLGLVFSGIQAFHAWEAVAGSRSSIAVKQLAVPAGLGALCLAIAVSIARCWRAARWLSGGAGVIVILYALALVLLGTEDVGGLLVSLPAGLVLAAFGVWNVRTAVIAGRGAA